MIGGASGARGARQRAVHAQVVFSREGEPAAARLFAFLLDEPDPAAQLEAGSEAEAGLEAARLGFSGWRRHIEAEVADAIVAGPCS